MRVRIALAGLLVFVGLTGLGSARAETNQECTNNEDITIVVDFQNVDGRDDGVNVRCASQPINNGFDAFHRANISVEDYNGFVCRIAGLPQAGPCNRYPPSNAYWVYWVAPRGGDWCAANLGAGARTPPPGSIEGWSFALNSKGKPPKPRYPVPGVIPGQTPRPLNADDCNTEMAPAPTTTTVVAAPPSGGGGSPTTSGVQIQNGAATTSPPRPSAGATVVAPADPSTTSTSGPIQLYVVRGATTSSIPLGDKDLSLKKSRDDGPPWGFIGGAGIIVGLGVVGVVLRRRDFFGQ